MYGGHPSPSPCHRSRSRGGPPYQRGGVPGAEVRRRRIPFLPGVRHLRRDKTAFAVDKGATAAGATSLVVKAFLLNILNPKLTIFFLAFLPQFVDPSAASPIAELLLLSGVFMAMTFVVFVVYGFLAHAFRAAVIDSPRVQSWLRRGFAAAFAGLGSNLVFSER